MWRETQSSRDPSRASPMRTRQLLPAGCDARHPAGTAPHPQPTGVTPSSVRVVVNRGSVWQFLWLRGLGCGSRVQIP